MREIHVMLKPASGLCNMQCRYCFYADETSKRNTANFGIMSFDTLHSVLEKVLREVTHSCTIAFQGGEPTLAGLSFFRQAVSICKGKNVNRCKISFANSWRRIIFWSEYRWMAQKNCMTQTELIRSAKVHIAE